MPAPIVAAAEDNENDKTEKEKTRTVKRMKQPPPHEKKEQQKDFVVDETSNTKLSFGQLCMEAARVFHEGSIVTPDLDPRSLLLNLSSRIGDISFIVHDCNISTQENLQKEVEFRAKEVFLVLCAAARACNIDLATAVMFKMEVNKAKYPTKVSKGSLAKCTSHSDVTGVTKENNVLMTTCAIGNKDKPTLSATTNEVINTIQQFSSEQFWNECHTFCNLAFALCVEAGELMEIFQWKQDDALMEQLTSQEKCHAASEFADVMVFLLRLMQLCETDIEKGMLRFFEFWHK